MQPPYISAVTCPLSSMLVFSQGPIWGADSTFLNRAAVRSYVPLCQKKKKGVFSRWTNQKKRHKKKKSLIPIWRISKRCPCGRAHGLTEESTFVGRKKCTPGSRRTQRSARVPAWQVQRGFDGSPHSPPGPGAFVQGHKNTIMSDSPAFDIKHGMQNPHVKLVQMNIFPQ